MAQDLGTALGWEDDSQVTDSQFELLPNGEYEYEVVDLTHERFNGSEKMAACPVAALKLRCTNNEASGTGFCRLFLNSKVVWKITAFFKSCGLIPANTPEGTKFNLSLFDQVVGCTGKVKVTTSKSTRNGRTYENNEYQFIVPKAQTAPTRAPQQRSWGGQGFD